MQTIWITGGSSGIGFAVAQKFLEENWRVIISSRNEDKLKKAVDDVKLQSTKQRGRMKRSFQKMEEDIDPARQKLRRTTQRLGGKKVTESGFNKGKDL